MQNIDNLYLIAARIEHTDEADLFMIESEQGIGEAKKQAVREVLSNSGHNKQHGAEYDPDVSDMVEEGEDPEDYIEERTVYIEAAFLLKEMIERKIVAGSQCMEVAVADQDDLPVSPGWG